MAESLIAGRYQLERILGAGGMGTVHLAMDTLLHRRVAVKLLTNAVAGSTLIAAALREARAAAALTLNVPDEDDYQVVAEPFASRR